MAIAAWPSVRRRPSRALSREPHSVSGFSIVSLERRQTPMQPRAPISWDAGERRPSTRKTCRAITTQARAGRRLAVGEVCSPPRGNLKGCRIALVGNTSWYLLKFRAGTIRALRNLGAKVICIAPRDAATARLVSELSAEHVVWELDPNGANPFKEIRSLISMAAILASHRPDFVFNFTIKPNIYSGMACRVIGLSYANNITGLGMTLGNGTWLSRIAGILYRTSNRGAQRIFVQNPDDLAVLRRLDLVGDVQVIEIPGSGVDLERFVAEPLQAMPPTFVMVGRLQADKGVREFVAAARQMRQQCPNARFVLVGPTDYVNRTGIPAKELEKWRGEGVVEIPGPTDDIRPWLAAAHAVVLPSHGGEGMPRVLLEAAAAGRPAIVSDVPGCRHAVIDGETGFVCPVREVPALVEAMTRLADLPASRLVEMGAAARTLAEQRFSESVVINAYLDCVGARVYGGAD